MRNRLFTIPALLSMLFLTSASAVAGPLRGAIFTTNSTGVTVNANQYASPCSVYLDGGPGPHAPTGAAGLPDGQYYFQVTDASGKQLLSTDVVSNRSFQVQNGVIVAYTGSGGPIHVTGPDQVNQGLGGVTIRLANLSCPADFMGSTNGVYKVWVTPVANFTGDVNQVDSPCGGGCFHGFVPSASKTDNFKVNTASATFCLTVQKLFLQSDGVTFAPQPNWEFDVTDPLAVTNQYFTDTTGEIVVCDLAPGIYTVAEDPNASVVDITGYNGVVLNPTSIPASVWFSWQVGQPEPGIVFKNQYAPPPPPQ